MLFPRLGRGLLVALTVAGFSGFGTASHAEDAAGFPSKPIEILVQSGAGSASDIFARTLARAAEPLFGQPVMVIDRSGGSGAVQMAALKAAKPDGYTLGTNTLSHFTTMLTTLKGSFSPSDFSWISMHMQDPHVLMVRADDSSGTIQGLVEKIKASGNGEITVGGYGSMGYTASLAMQMFADAAGFKINWVGYKATPEAMTALLGGHVDLAIANPGPVRQFADAGRLRVLTILGDREIDTFPGVPTAEGAGYPFDSSWQQIRGIYGPAGIPRDIQDKLSQTFIKAAQTPEFQEYLKNIGGVSAAWDAEEYQARTKAIVSTAEAGLRSVGAIQ
jgi:putative tricarboxylic transport membrane protein